MTYKFTKYRFESKACIGYQFSTSSTHFADKDKRLLQSFCFINQLRGFEFDLFFIVELLGKDETVKKLRRL